MTGWPSISATRADIVILHAPEARRNYNLAIAMRQGYLRHNDMIAALTLDDIAELSLEIWFERIEEKVTVVG